MHSFSISQPIDGTCSLLLLPETKSVVLFFFRHSWNAIEEEAITLSVYSLLLLQFLPIFVSFVAISAVLCRCFKVMSLVGILA